MARASAAAVDRLSTRSQDLAEADLPPPPPPLKPVPVIHTQAYLVQTQQLPQVSSCSHVVRAASAKTCSSFVRLRGCWPGCGNSLAWEYRCMQCLIPARCTSAALTSQVPQLLSSTDEFSQQQQHADLDSNALVWALKK
jgi:hypothetical protein